MTAFEMRALAVATALLATGCSQALPPLPLRPEPIAYADTLPIPEPDEQNERRELRTMLIHGPLQLAEPFDPGLGEALNLTHDDDVVSSAWWERRMGYRPISPTDLARAHTSPARAPAATGRLVIKSLKTEGVTPGFNMEDEKDDSYVVKFDPPDFPYLQSAAGVIVQRLMWGVGYHVPEDYIADIDPDRLEVDEDATIVVDGVERPLTMEDVRVVLQKAKLMGDGRYHVIASRYVPGIPKGPILFMGVREDDPNDHYRHEYRRELRALQVISAWVNNTDLREGNTMDVYVEPGYLRHYIIDFTTALGSASTRAKHPKDEDERPVDLYRFLARLATLGAYSEEWETEDFEIDPSLGFMRGEDFDPEKWDPTWTNPAFAAMTDADAYWAAKIVAAFSDEHVGAAVATGALPRPELESTLTRQLTARRDRLVEFWFGRVSTLEEPVVAGQTANSLRLSVRDLGIERGVWTAEETVYDWRFEHSALGRSGSGSAQPRTGADQLLQVSWTGGPAGAGPARDLAVLEVVTRRPGLSPTPARVFLRWDGQGYQVAGIVHGDPEG